MLLDRVGAGSHTCFTIFTVAWSPRVNNTSNKKKGTKYACHEIAVF